MIERRRRQGRDSDASRRRGLKPLRCLLALVSLFWLFPPLFAQGSPLKSDEQVILFPTTARLDETGATWIVPVHGWVFEAEETSLWRRAVVEGLLKGLELEPEVAGEALFRERARMFLVDNEGGKRLRLGIGGQVVTVGPSASNGHFTGLARVLRANLAAEEGGGWAALELVMPEGDARRFTGSVRLGAARGLSLISDIDDTIKVSEVTDKQALLANTFLRPYQAVPGMAAVYRRWAADGAVFHYISPSPWQLFPAPSPFLAEQDFPAGSFHLKTFRLKDRTFLDLFAAPAAYKVPLIEGLLADFPGRHFVLVGDSSEQDPEIYAAVAARHPERVRHIFIRDVSPGGDAADRFARAFRAIPRKRWTVFTDARRLPAMPFEE